MDAIWTVYSRLRGLLAASLGSRPLYPSSRSTEFWGGESGAIAGFSDASMRLFPAGA